MAKKAHVLIFNGHGLTLQALAPAQCTHPLYRAPRVLQKTLGQNIPCVTLSLSLSPKYHCDSKLKGNRECDQTMLAIFPPRPCTTALLWVHVQQPLRREFRSAETRERGKARHLGILAGRRQAMAPQASGRKRWSPVIFRFGAAPRWDFVEMGCVAVW